MITTEMKDAVVKYLIDNEKDLLISTKTEGVVSGCSRQYFIGILEDLKDRKMLEYRGTSDSYSHVTITIRVKLFDFFQNGGFRVIDEVGKMELLKLKREIELLHEEIPKAKYDVLMTGIGTILSVWSMFKPG